MSDMASVPGGRHAVLVDARYLLASAGQLVPGPSTRRHRVSAEPLIAALLARAAERIPGELLRMYWYDAARDRVPTVEQRQIAALPHVKVRLGNLDSAGRHKGVDAQLRQDLEVLARHRAVTDVVLLAGDEDMVPAVEAAQAYGVRVHVWGVEPPYGVNQAERLVWEADTVDQLDTDFVRPYLEADLPPADPAPTLNGSAAAGPAPGGSAPGGAALAGSVPDGSAAAGPVPGGTPGGSVPGGTPGGAVPAASAPGGSAPSGSDLAESAAAGPVPDGAPVGSVPVGSVPAGTGLAGSAVAGSVPGGTDLAGSAVAGVVSGGAPVAGADAAGSAVAGVESGGAPVAGAGSAVAGVESGGALVAGADAAGSAVDGSAADGSAPVGPGAAPGAAAPPGPDRPLMPTPAEVFAARKLQGATGAGPGPASAPARTGADRLGSERLGTERLGPERPGPERPEMERIGARIAARWLRTRGRDNVADLLPGPVLPTVIDKELLVEAEEEISRSLRPYEEARRALRDGFWATLQHEFGIRAPDPEPHPAPAPAAGAPGPALAAGTPATSHTHAPA